VVTVFGLGRKTKGFDMLLVKLDNGSAEGARVFQSILFPAAAANDLVQLMTRLQKSKLNSKEYLGEYGGFTILAHIESAEKFNIMDTVHPEAEPLPIQDFASLIINRFNSLLSQEELVEGEDAFENEEDQEDLVFFIGEFTLMKDGSF
jgi:hypothetical protein